MKLAFNSWVYSSFPVWVPSYPLSEVIERVAAIGYDGIEIGAASPHAFPDYLDAKQRREIRRILEANNLALAGMLPAPGGGPGLNVASPMPEERAAAVEQYKKVADLCADLGGSTLLYVAGWQVFGTSRKQA
jgi:protein FrlC